MKVLVFEDEYTQIEGLLEYMNFKYFDKKLEFVNYRTSQDLKEHSELDVYDVILVDIQLDYKSQLDGISLINEIIEYDKNKNILIITGKGDIILDELKNKKLDFIKIINKPLDDLKLSNAIKSFF